MRTPLPLLPLSERLAIIKRALALKRDGWGVGIIEKRLKTQWKTIEREAKKEGLA
mgnify:CR=1 FL=1